MTTEQARQKFDFHWTVVGASVVLVASISLLHLSLASLSLVAISAVGVVAAGLLARRFLTREFELRHFLLSSRMRLLLVGALCAAALFIQRSNPSAVMSIAGILLWTSCIGVALQIAARYSTPPKLLPYVQFVGDFWTALFLVLLGANWLVIAAVLAFAGATSMVAVEERDRRLLILEGLSTAALLVIVVPVAARGFGCYLLAVVVLTIWSADHLVVLATHLRIATVSGSDG